MEEINIVPKKVEQINDHLFIDTYKSNNINIVVNDMTVTTMWREWKKRAEVRIKVDQFWEIYMSERELEFDSLIYLEPVEKFKNKSNVMTFRSFGDSTSSRVKDKLKSIRLCSR